MMKSTGIIMFTIGFILFPCFLAFAVERCIMCGMDTQKSETKFTVQITEGTKEVPSGEYSFCCLHCLVLLKARIKGGKIDSIMVRDYNTVTHKYDSGDMIDARKAFYLVESRLRPKGSMVPFMLVFSAQETAETFQEVYGGRVLDWEGIWKYTQAHK
ncbi:MAG: nitrous oxide reductase accessory protein NosL [Thermodesulfobacteriota bacterium]|nr:nitrous oxide reductase accessory protein NosL [Thermodesulfobacteriota bacterium]